MADDFLIFLPRIHQEYQIIGDKSATLTEIDALQSSLPDNNWWEGSYAHQKDYWSLMKVR